MEFESVGKAAERYKVTVRTIQKWAKEGKIPGAKKEGRDWWIPIKEEESEKTMPVSTDIPVIKRIPMLLLNTDFPLGHCEEAIESIQDEDMRHLAKAEYYYFSGRPDEASAIAEPYMESHIPAVRMTAGFLCMFSNVSRGHLHLTKFAMDILKEELGHGLPEGSSQELQAASVLFSTATSVLFHLEVEEPVPLEDYIGWLPEGLKMFGYYILAFKAYLKKEYAYSLGIVDSALMIYSGVYPIASIYLNLVATMDLMSMMQVEAARTRFMKAWDLAREDNLIEAFGEHQTLLQGMVEVNFKKQYPKDYARITAISNVFSTGWRKVHSMITNKSVVDNLTTIEFAIAMLYNRGWTVKEIASYMELSARTISNYLQVIYEKLNIKGKKALREYMLQ